VGEWFKWVYSLGVLFVLRLSLRRIRCLLLTYDYRLVLNLYTFSITLACSAYVCSLLYLALIPAPAITYLNPSLPCFSVSSSSHVFVYIRVSAAPLTLSTPPRILFLPSPLTLASHPFNHFRFPLSTMD